MASATYLKNGTTRMTTTNQYDYLYDRYGNTLSLSGALASLNVYRFASKEWNTNAGFYYFGRRYYNPMLQRWPNRDPIVSVTPSTS
jgi:RHS repeat-associated protein